MGSLLGDAVLRLPVRSGHVDVSVTVAMHWDEGCPWGAGAPLVADQTHTVTSGPALLRLPDGREATVDVVAGNGQDTIFDFTGGPPV
jgi:hypothetical protein